MALTEGLSRRGALRLAAGGAALGALGACRDEGWYGIDVAGTLPDLSFEMTRADDGASVTEADYRGRVVALFFGYTFCPDICPMTLANLTALAERLGELAREVSFLFVTVDPRRDTPEVMRRYVGFFTPRADGLRGTDNQLAILARRFRVTYRVEPHEDDRRYTVSHGQSVYVFDRAGAARVMWPAFDSPEADIGGGAGDLRRLIAA